jgi:hypothetical protein
LKIDDFKSGIGPSQAPQAIVNLQSAIVNSSGILTTVLILYLVLVLSTMALLWAAGACYVRVRRHLAARLEAEAEHERTQAARRHG